MLRHTGGVLCAVVLCAVGSSPARAALVTYTFEAPNFSVGQTTPLLNRAPNVGDPAFLASFTSAPDPTGFQITFGGQNPLMVGQVLLEPSVFPTADTLTVTLNQPVNSVQFAFAIDQPAAGTPGSITLQSPVGNQTTPAGNVGGIFQGGTFSFTSPTPFTTFSLLANGPTGARTEFAIDNLTLNTVTAAVPEPSTCALLLVGLGVGGVAAARRRLRRSAGS